PAASGAGSALPRRGTSLCGRFVKGRGLWTMRPRDETGGSATAVQHSPRGRANWPRMPRSVATRPLAPATRARGAPARPRSEKQPVQTTAKIADFRYNPQMTVSKVQPPPMLTPDRAAMENFLGMCHRRRYPGKTAIIRPGDSANILYYVIDGSLTVSSEDEEGRELILAYLNRGEFIGEMGLFVETPRREVMVRTRTPCELAEIGYERMFN